MRGVTYPRGRQAGLQVPYEGEALPEDHHVDFVSTLEVHHPQILENK